MSISPLPRLTLDQKRSLRPFLPLQYTSSRAGQRHSQIIENHPGKWSFCLKASSCISAHYPAQSTGICFVHISTVHEGAFVLIVSEIILAPDSPMWFPWRLEKKNRTNWEIGWRARGYSFSLVKSKRSLHKMQNSGWNPCASRISPMDKALNGFLLYWVFPQSCWGDWESTGSENQAEDRAWPGSSSKGENGRKGQRLPNPTHLICWIPWFPDSAVAMHIIPSIPKEFSWRLGREKMETSARASQGRTHFWKQHCIILWDSSGTDCLQVP